MKMKMKGSDKYAAGSSNRSDRPCRKGCCHSDKEVQEVDGSESDMSQYLWINLITNRAESLSKLVLG